MLGFLLAAVDAYAQADLGVSKLVSNATPNVGDNITFTITLTNNGSATANGVAVTDPLPPGLTFVSAIAGQGSYASGSGIWSVGTIPNAASRTLSIVATVASANPQTNTATITASDQLDANISNNSSSVTETPQVANLSVSKGVSNATPNVGDNITFTVTLSNAGPNTATNVALTDALPSGLSFVSSIASQGSYVSGTGVWTVGTVTTATPQTLTIVATVASGSARTNTGSISHSDQFDPDAGNNSASATETPQQSNLSVLKSVSNSTPNVGDNVTFTITLTNLGPDTATTVVVADALPAGLTFVSATASQGSYVSGTGVWTVGTVTTATPQTLTIVATMAASTTLTNIASISHSDQFDPNTANNSASATVSSQQANLAVAKSVSNATPNVGNQISFTVTVSNSGPATATGVQLVDLLPAGLTFVSATASQGSYSSGTGVWSVGTVTTGGPQTLTIFATVAGTGPITNIASISHSDQFDPSVANNTAAAALTATTGVPTLPTKVLILLIGTLALLAVRSLRVRRDAGRSGAIR